MPRILSAQAVAAGAARETGVLLLQALKIELADSTVLRVVNNTENITVAGVGEFTAYGFQLDMPEETEEGFGTARITIDNVDQWLTAYLRNQFGPIEVTFYIVSETDLTADPKEFDNIEFQSRPLRLRDVAYDAKSVRGVLYYEDTLRQKWPPESFTPQHFSGLF